MNLFIEYPKCSTCKKARTFLEQNSIPFTKRHILEMTPTKEELEKWITKSGREIKTFFNTSGNLYKELNLKEKLETMTDDEKISLLSSNGMLIKRPLLVTDDEIYSGFSEKKWSTLLKNK